MTEDWIITLEMENRLPCRPAGRPMRMISRRLFRSIRHSCRFSCVTPRVRNRHSRTRTMLTTWLATVAMATPATSIWNTITSSRLSATFTRPEIIR